MDVSEINNETCMCPICSKSVDLVAKTTLECSHAFCTQCVINFSRRYRFFNCKTCNQGNNRSKGILGKQSQGHIYRFNSESDSTDQTNNETILNSEQLSLENSHINIEQNTTESLITRNTEQTTVQIIANNFEQNISKYVSNNNTNEPVKKNLSEVTKNKDCENMCAVCFESIEKISKTTLVCNHTYCTKCIVNIAKCNAKFKCPLCRDETHENLKPQDLKYQDRWSYIIPFLSQFDFPTLGRNMTGMARGDPEGRNSARVAIMPEPETPTFGGRMMVLTGGDSAYGREFPQLTEENIVQRYLNARRNSNDDDDDEDIPDLIDAAELESTMTEEELVRHRNRFRQDQPYRVSESRNMSLAEFREIYENSYNRSRINHSVNDDFDGDEMNMVSNSANSDNVRTNLTQEQLYVLLTRNERTVDRIMNIIQNYSQFSNFHGNDGVNIPNNSQNNDVVSNTSDVLMDNHSAPLSNSTSNDLFHRAYMNSLSQNNEPLNWLSGYSRTRELYHDTDTPILLPNTFDEQRRITQGNETQIVGTQTAVTHDNRTQLMIRNLQNSNTPIAMSLGQQLIRGPFTRVENSQSNNSIPTAQSNVNQSSLNQISELQIGLQTRDGDSLVVYRNVRDINEEARINQLRTKIESYLRNQMTNHQPENRNSYQIRRHISYDTEIYSSNNNQPPREIFRFIDSFASLLMQLIRPRIEQMRQNISERLEQRNQDAQSNREPNPRVQEPTSSEIFPNLQFLTGGDSIQGSDFNLNLSSERGRNQNLTSRNGNDVPLGRRTPISRHIFSTSPHIEEVMRTRNERMASHSNIGSETSNINRVNLNNERSSPVFPFYSSRSPRANVPIITISELSPLNDSTPMSEENDYHRGGEDLLTAQQIRNFNLNVRQTLGRYVRNATSDDERATVVILRNGEILRENEMQERTN